MTKIAESGSGYESGSGSISQRHGSPDPDPPTKCHGSATLVLARVFGYAFLFIWIQIRLPWYFMRIRIRIFLIIVVMGIGNDCLQTLLNGSILSLRASIVSVYGPPWLHFEPIKLLHFYFNAELDPVLTFHSNAVPDPQPYSFPSINTEILLYSKANDSTKATYSGTAPY
jgi:hypothetical protein